MGNYTSKGFCLGCLDCWYNAECGFMQHQSAVTQAWKAVGLLDSLMLGDC